MTTLTLLLALQVDQIREADSARLDYDALVCHSPAYAYPVRLKGRLIFQGERFRAEFTQSDPDGGGPVSKTLVSDGRKLRIRVDGRAVSEIDAPPRLVEGLKASFVRVGAAYPLAELALSRPRCFIRRAADGTCPPGCADHPRKIASALRLRTGLAAQAPEARACRLAEERRRPGKGGLSFDAEEDWTGVEIAPKIPDNAFALPP